MKCLESNRKSVKYLWFCRMATMLYLFPTPNSMNTRLWMLRIKLVLAIPHLIPIRPKPMQIFHLHLVMKLLISFDILQSFSLDYSFTSFTPTSVSVVCSSSPIVTVYLTGVLSGSAPSSSSTVNDTLMIGWSSDFENKTRF